APNAPNAPIPDLLSVRPKVRVDVAELRQTLVFAFAIGSTLEAFEVALGSASLPETDWDRANFERDLFLEQLVARCLGINIDGRSYAPCAAYLLRAIAGPPRDADVLAFRREILRELASSPDRRGEFERIYLHLVRIRALLCAGRQQPAQGLRRLEILR